MARYKRTKYMVNPAQTRLLAVNLLYYLIFVGSLSAILWGPLISGLNSPLTVPAVREHLAHLFLYLHVRILPVALVLAVLSAVHSVIVSHRVVGPLARFKRSYERIGAGHLGETLRLRRRDYLHDEAEALNAMTAELASRVSRVEERFSELHSEWRSFRSEVEGDEHAALADRLPRLEEGFAATTRALSAFELAMTTDRTETLEAQPAIRCTPRAGPEPGTETGLMESRAGERPL